jgi:hypothetical protein
MAAAETDKETKAAGHAQVQTILAQLTPVMTQLLKDGEKYGIDMGAADLLPPKLDDPNALAKWHANINAYRDKLTAARATHQAELDKMMEGINFDDGSSDGALLNEALVESSDDDDELPDLEETPPKVPPYEPTVAPIGDASSGAGAGVAETAAQVEAAPEFVGLEKQHAASVETADGAR